MSTVIATDTDALAPPKRIGRRSNGMLLSPQEFDRIRHWAEGYRYELVNGVLIVVPPAGAGERSPNDDLGARLKIHQWNHAQGSRIDETLPEQTIIAGDNRRIADRAVWVGLGRYPDPEVDVPTIAIEFVSQSRRDQLRDYETKRKEYIAVGVQEYWIIDRFRRRFTVCRADGQTLVFAPEQEYQTGLLSGFVLRLSEIFAAADRYSRRRPKPDERK